MLHEEYLSMTMDDIDVSAYITEFEGNDITDVFEDFKLSDFVLDNDSIDLLSMLDEHTQANNNNNNCLFDTPQNSVVPTDAMVPAPDIDLDNMAIVGNSQTSDDGFEQNPNYDLYEETIVQHDVNQVSEQVNSAIDENPFESIADTMVVKVQPKADQRARYESDGARFLPDAKRHPMSIELPGLKSKPCKQNETYGTILTMVTSRNNPQDQAFLHINDIKYRTDDAIELGNGSIFLPITAKDIRNCEQIFPRLSIICKKFHEYTFDLTPFNPSTEDRIVEKYTLIDEDNFTKAAKGKQFTIDYDLLCYKMVFQLAFKRDNHFFVSHIQCETNIINEQKAPTKGMKGKALSDKKISRKRKNIMNKRNTLKKSKALLSSVVEHSAIRTSNGKTK